MLGDEACEKVAFEVLPESFDGIEVRAVWRQIERLDVMPMECLHFVPTRVVQNQNASSLRHGGDFFRHCIQEHLEDISIAMRDNQADELSTSWIDRTDDILPDVFSEVSLGDPFSSLCPLSPGPRVAFKSRFVAEKQIATLILNELEKFSGKDLPLVFPCFPIRRLRHGAWDLELVIVFMEVSHQGAVGDDEVLLRL